LGGASAVRVIATLRVEELCVRENDREFVVQAMKKRLSSESRPEHVVSEEWAFRPRSWLDGGPVKAPVGCGEIKTCFAQHAGHQESGILFAHQPRPSPELNHPLAGHTIDQPLIEDFCQPYDDRLPATAAVDLDFVVVHTNDVARALPMGRVRPS
jgi:hypothetical protein